MAISETGIQSSGARADVERANRDRLLDALGHASASLALLRGPDLVYEYATPLYCRLSRIEGNPVGKAFGLTPRQDARARALFERVYTSGEPFHASEYGLRFDEHSTDDDAYFNIAIVPVRDATGKIDGILLQGFDVTALVLARKEVEAQRAQLQASQAQLLQVQKLESLGVLAGGIAHDFNNLLTAILGGASTASLVLPADSPAQAHLRDTVLAVRRAADLTRQLLAYSGKGHFEVRPVDLSTVVHEIARLLETSVPRNVQLRLELPRALPAVEADVVQLQQVVMNLVINGAEAIGDRSGTVTVTASVRDLDEASVSRAFAEQGLAAGRYVHFQVRDTGSGMDEATREKIFDPFFTTKFAGRGLGLAPVLGIVRAHRGAIQVESAPGQGTTFSILLPASSQRALTSRESEFPKYRGAGQLVMVVDDDDGVRDPETAARALRLRGRRSRRRPGRRADRRGEARAPPGDPRHDHARDERRGDLRRATAHPAGDPRHPHQRLRRGGGLATVRVEGARRLPPEAVHDDRSRATHREGARSRLIPLRWAAASRPPGTWRDPRRSAGASAAAG
ncbi:MAG: two-component system sensor histidine kinase NtrB [Polyangiaceae bacterium]